MPDVPASDDFPRTGNPATDYSIALLVWLVRAGVRHIVLSPGSRSQALALVSAELERIGVVCLHVRTDERVGAFTALGIGRETGESAVVITTSGTATANVHPAVMEAFEARTPLIVITADRPPELRGIRSNQTSWQRGLFGATIGLSLEATATPLRTNGGESGQESLGAGGARESGQEGLSAGGFGEQAASAHESKPELATAEIKPMVVNEAACDSAAGQVANDPKLIAQQLWEASRGEAGSATAPGPVHLNLAFREPLSVAVPDLSRVFFQRRLSSPQPAVGESFFVEPGPGTIVIAGDGAGPQAEEFARLGGFPLIAEVASGAHFGPNLVVAYRELLAEPVFRESVATAVVFGHPTLSREVPQLLASPVQTLVVDPWGAAGLAPFYSPGRAAHPVASVRTTEEPLNSESRAWVGSWVTASRHILEKSREESAQASPVAADQESTVRPLSDHRAQAAYARAALAMVREPVNRRMLVEAVWRFTWPHDRLVVGASRLIRDLDRRALGRKVRVHANRGLAGIDGTISSGFGVALAACASDHAGQAAGTTRILLGDLSFLHDVGALLLSPGEATPPVQVIVGNDGGGTIFDGLEVAATAGEEAMRRVMTTPRTVDMEALATAYGWRYRRATSRGELDQALSEAPITPTLIEVPLSD